MIPCGGDAAAIVVAAAQPGDTEHTATPIRCGIRKDLEDARLAAAGVSKDQAEALQSMLNAELRQLVTVALAMRYGNPSIPSGLDDLRRAGSRAGFCAAALSAILRHHDGIDLRCGQHGNSGAGAGCRSCVLSTITTTTPAISPRWRRA